MGRFIKFLGGFAVLIVAVGVAGVVVLKSKDFNEYRGLIADEVKAATGRDLVIAGDLQLDISSSPSITVEGVSFSNAAWGSRPEMLKIGRFSAKVELWPLLGGDVRVNRLILDGLDALLETDKKGRGNWELDGMGGEKAAGEEPRTGAAGLPVVNLVEMRNINVVYRDGQTGQTTAFSLDRLVSSADGIDSPMNMKMAGTLNGESFGAEGRLGSIKGLLDGGAPWPVGIAFNGPGLKANIDGVIASPLEGKGLNLNLSVNIDDAAATARIAGISGLNLPPLKVSGMLKDSKGGYRLEGLDIKTGSSDLKGDISIAVANRPRIDANLSSTQFNLDELQAGDAAKAAPDGAGDGRVFPADPLPFDALKGADIKLKIKIGKLVSDGITTTDIDLGLDLDKGNLSISPLKVSVGGGSISGTIKLDARKAKPGLSIKLQGRGVNFGKVLLDMGEEDLLSSNLNMDINIQGRGASVREIMAGLNGSTAVVGRDGRINSSAIETMATGFLDALPWAANADANKINCIVSRFDIKLGIATSRVLVLDTNGITVSGEGNLDLREERIKMTVIPNAKSTSLASLAIPISIGGSFANPSFAPNVGKVVEGLVTGTVGGLASGLQGLLGSNQQGASGSDDPCVSALGGKPAAKTTTASPPPAPTTNAVDEGLNKLGEGLKKSLGGLFGN